jgi:hypothetical protein
MKSLLALVIFSIAGSVYAETCTFVLGNYRRDEIQRFTRYDYSRERACADASYDCQRELNDRISRRGDRGLECRELFDGYPVPNPGPNPWPAPSSVCQTDLVDQWGRVMRSFSAEGRSESDACEQSDRSCKIELARSNIYGARCETRGSGGGRPNPPTRMKTETCNANRFDPAGMYIESYSATQTGSWDSDVRRMACDQALRICSSEIRGRQYCQVQ